MDMDALADAEAEGAHLYGHRGSPNSDAVAVRDRIEGYYVADAVLKVFPIGYIHLYFIKHLTEISRFNK